AEQRETLLTRGFPPARVLDGVGDPLPIRRHVDRDAKGKRDLCEGILDGEWPWRIGGGGRLNGEQAQEQDHRGQSSRVHLVLSSLEGRRIVARTRPCEWTRQVVKGRGSREESGCRAPSGPASCQA